MANPWLTSDDLIAAIKRKISFPVAQNTFSNDEILAFANEEMSMAQVPSVMMYHEEYFVTTKTVALAADTSRYEIPERAIGSKLRDLFYSDTQGNLYEMTRISSEDKGFFQHTGGTTTNVHKFYLQGNDVVLAPSVSSNPSGSLVFEYFLRPNQLVQNERAAIITYFNKVVTVSNSTLVAGNTITLNGQIFTAVAAAPSSNQFVIGATAIETATNLCAAVNTNGVAIATNGSPATAIATFKFTTLAASQAVTTINSTAFSIASTQGIQFSSVPTNIVEGSVVDFLQTKPGHRTRAMDVTIPSGAISDSQIAFVLADVPDDLVIGDYICLANECIIPQIPTDLHSALAERTGARILAAIGDQAGLQVSQTKIAENEQRQGTLLDNRVDGACQKINNRHSLLRQRTIGSRRRL